MRPVIPLLIVGESDITRREGNAQAFAKKAKEAGVAVNVSVAKARNHLPVARRLPEDKNPVLEQIRGSR
jgi:hypothetical protein